MPVTMRGSASSVAALPHKRGEMIVPVFRPPSRIDAKNLAEFASAVSEQVARHQGMVIDCSAVVWIAISGFRVLEAESSNVPITLVNPNPAVHLMAVAFGGHVHCRYDASPSRTSPQPSSNCPCTEHRPAQPDSASLGRSVRRTRPGDPPLRQSCSMATVSETATVLCWRPR